MGPVTGFAITEDCPWPGKPSVLVLESYKGSTGLEAVVSFDVFLCLIFFFSTFIFFDVGGTGDGSLGGANASLASDSVVVFDQRLISCGGL